MKEFKIGIRVDSDSQLSYFGLDELNQALVNGGRLIQIKEGDALMEKIGTERGHVKLKLSGFSLLALLEL